MEDTRVFTSKFSRIHPLAFSFSVCREQTWNSFHLNSSHYPWSYSPFSFPKLYHFPNEILLRMKYLLWKALIEWYTKWIKKKFMPVNQNFLKSLTSLSSELSCILLCLFSSPQFMKAFFLPIKLSDLSRSQALLSTSSITTIVLVVHEGRRLSMPPCLWCYNKATGHVCAH